MCRDHKYDYNIHFKEEMIPLVSAITLYYSDKNLISEGIVPRPNFRDFFVPWVQKVWEPLP
jgi:hypothetical protein